MKSAGHVHVVDDNADIRRLLALVLSTKGYSVETYEDAFAFLQKTAEHPCEILILDVRMPKMNGIELQAKLLAEGRKTPIIFISGECQPHEMEAIQAAGWVEFLWKPFNTDQLMSAIDKAFAVHALQPS
jgi:two-component system response regulator FixJ